jgi:biofilm PGA synthesis N-glycosyltransferase PgaC
MQSVLDSIIFWSAWIIIPVIVEIIPALGSVFLLLKRRLQRRHDLEEPALWPEISLIVPVYNSADTLEACIASVDASRYPNKNIRMFLVNNKSSDDSFQVFGRCQKRFPDIRMQWLEAEQGKSKALNLALYNSEGEYIINMDSDGVLDPDALTNLIKRFEHDPSINVMTGAILTDPEKIMAYPTPFSRLLRRLEFVEYAQAFLAGRSFSSEFNAVYTLSGAFSAFRKSAVLGSWMYNTNTISEDTQITFQMRYLFKQRVEMCEEAIFYVDPIESMNKLYTQRQRWQRGSLEVAHLFPQSDLKVRRVFTDVNIYTLLFDHTFAFPRMIWYIALLCLMAMNVSATVIALSILMIFALYILVGYLYFFCTLALLKMRSDVRRFYARQWWVMLLMPLYNIVTFFIRLAGIINSIGSDSVWKTRDLTQERTDFGRAFREETSAAVGPIRRLRRWANGEGSLRGSRDNKKTKTPAPADAVREGGHRA